MVPGDPIAALLGPEGSPELMKQMRQELGLDRPVPEQYFDWVRNALRGDLGVTFKSRQEITPILIGRIPATLELAGAALFVALALGMPAGLLAGLKKNSRLDHLFSVLALSGLSMPSFWVATLLMIALGLNLKLLPTSGYVPFTEDPKRNLAFLIMPAFSLGFTRAPYIARMTRAAIIETLQEPFVGFSRAKGLREKTIFLSYIFRHSVCQIVVIVAMVVGRLLGGQIIIEEFFMWPGMGRLSIAAVMERDYYMMQACILLFAGVFLIVNLLADLLHAWLDPRIQLK
jgi:peptide/nickel transport system permease protein